MHFLLILSSSFALPLLAGSQAVHAAVELRGELVHSAREKLAAYGCTHVDLRHGNCLELDATSSMAFARIYVGAGADESIASTLFSMLELGGILVGPFAGPDGAQRLLSVRRLGETTFQVRELMSVQFTPLLTHAPLEERAALAALAALANPAASAPSAAPTATPPVAGGTAAHRDASATPKRAGQGARALSIRIEAPVWSPDCHERFPASHRAAVCAVLLAHQRDGTLLGSLPKEILLQELLPKVGYHAFAAPPPSSLEGPVLVEDGLSDDGASEAGASEAADDESVSDDAAESEDEPADIMDASADEGGPAQGHVGASTTQPAATPMPPTPRTPPTALHHSCSRLLRCL